MKFLDHLQGCCAEERRAGVNGVILQNVFRSVCQSFCWGGGVADRDPHLDRDPPLLTYSGDHCSGP